MILNCGHHFWWFGYVHYTPLDDAASYKMTAKLGPNALDMTADDLRALFKGRRGRVKLFLLDQSKIAGIGNFYVQDILFMAQLHQLRTINTLSDAEIDALADAILTGLQPSLDKGGGYEVDLRGQNGAYTMGDVIIGYKEGQPCPECGTLIEKIKTGSASSFICPECQPLEP